MTTRQTNGAAIRALREAVGIRHGDFAKKVQKRIGRPFDPGYLTKIEKGDRSNPAPDITRAMAATLGVSLDAITVVVADREQVPA